MVCRSAHTRMPRACGKPGHFLWMHAERCSPAPVSPRDNRSSFHISTPGRSTACGRWDELCTVDKWHVSVDKPHHLGRGQDYGWFSGGFLRAHHARQATQAGACARWPSALSSTQFLVLHRRPMTPSEAAQSAAGAFTAIDAGGIASSSPPVITLHISPGPTMTASINTCKRDGREMIILPHRAAHLNHTGAA
jgi:hypothetical protein